MSEIWEFRSKFWQFDKVAGPTSAQRNRIITEMLKIFIDHRTMKFNFSVEKSNRTRTPVCERGFLLLHGYRSATSQWDRCKTKVRSIIRENIIVENPTSKLARPKSKPLFESAKAWIRDYAMNQTNVLVQQAQLKQMGDFVDTDQQEVNIRSVPFESETMFWEYYVKNSPSGFPVAGKKTFARALSSFAAASLTNEGFVVRLRRCKHNFSTCDICNNAQALLQDKSRRWAPGQKRIVEDYIEVHYKIQEAERQAQREAILRAKKLNSLGQPEEAFMLFDGFSIFKGVSPKWGKGTYGGKSHTEKEEPKVENRIIAGIVICGNVNTVFVYSMDQLVSGGANLMIEIIRRALSDLGELLKESNQVVPKILFLQFDNCGENKNKYMMAYCSMLVESGR